MTPFDATHPLIEPQMTHIMTHIMDGNATETNIEIFLQTLSTRTETVPELTAAAKVIRAKAHKIKAPHDAVDCCGTGGDGLSTYNISTAVALVAAACGVPVAKHGNRASSSKSGAADVLETLGVNLDAPQMTLECALNDLGFAFLMAPNHHQSMKHVAAARKKIGTRTLFNLLGPLANPAGTKRQLIGVYDQKWLIPIAETLHNLGTQKAWIVHSQDGLDEISISAPTYVAKLENSTITETLLTPDDFGLPTYDINDLTGGDATQNAAALLDLLNGTKNAYRDIVLANIAAVLTIHGTETDLKSATNRAAQAIDNKSALGLLNDYIERTNA